MGKCLLQKVCIVEASCGHSLLRARFGRCWTSSINNINCPQELDYSICLALLQMAGEEELKDRLHLLSKSFFLTRRQNRKESKVASEVKAELLGQLSSVLLHLHPSRVHRSLLKHTNCCWMYLCDQRLHNSDRHCRMAGAEWHNL